MIKKICKFFKELFNPEQTPEEKAAWNSWVKAQYDSLYESVEKAANSAKKGKTEYLSYKNRMEKYKGKGCCVTQVLEKELGNLYKLFDKLNKQGEK